MRKLLPSLLCAAITAVLPSVASATVILIGGNHTISGEVNDSVLVDQDWNAPGPVPRTALTVTSGGVIRRGLTLNGDSRLTVNGNGRVNADSNNQAIWVGQATHIRLSDTARVTGDIIGPHDTPARTDGGDPYRSVRLENRAVLDGDLNVSGNLYLSDQAVILGNVHHYQSIATQMTGGTIAGTLGGSGNVDHYLDMSGGAILGGLFHRNAWVHLDMSGGYLGGIDTSGVMLANISGGQIDGGISHLNHYNYGSISITGGAINADPGDYLISIVGTSYPYGTGSRLDLWGGQLGYREAGLGIWLDDAIDFNIYGWGLSFTDGLLSGYLSDGNWFSSALSFGSNWNGQLRLTDVSVPEPGTNALFALGLAALAWQVRSSRRSRRSGV
jgi:hypothetical protein